MDEWILFWKYLCGVGILIYMVTLVIIIPLGARDIFRLLNSLHNRHRAEKSPEPDKEEK